MTRIIWNALTALAAIVITTAPLSAAEVVTYYHNDHLGSPIAATDSTGAVVWQQAYDPWGFKLTANTDERGYTGNWLDEETGLADHKARWYTSSIGRFTGIDPVKWQESNIHSFNKYAYASNNPYAYVDRDGRNAVTFLGGLAVESYNALRGNGFNGARVLGALADGYNGEGAGFARSLYQDVESLVPVGAVAGALIKSGRLAKSLGKEVGILRDAARGKGNFGLGSATKTEANKLGKAWVGDGYKVASDGKTLVSKDGLRQYRPPSYKPRLERTQANFEQKVPGQQSNRWQSNGHLDITD
ncbi:RHS repeat-associated core domain-containing protein [Marinobacter sp.]|uniref:RHS repeat domain-containing protein n=1 Tax=Marinobacter sp. TaxID=50741 RepID=UPI00068E067D|nr:RHS repeat-associated core domain-containing protein [Marinobacter sp.]